MRRKMRLLSVALPVALARGSLLDPSFPGVYPYCPYAVYSMLPNYGQVKIETRRKDVVYIDSGSASTTDKDKKLALRPRRHDIEPRKSDGQTPFRERVAVTVGHTTKLRVS